MPKYNVGDILYTNNKINSPTYILVLDIDERYYYYQFLNFPTAAKSKIENVDTNTDISLWA